MTRLFHVLCLVMTLRLLVAAGPSDHPRPGLWDEPFRTVSHTTLAALQGWIIASGAVGMVVLQAALALTVVLVWRQLSKG